MAAKYLDRQLSRLEDLRYCFGRGDRVRVLGLLDVLGKGYFPDAQTLIRFHEALMFLRAFPQGPGVVRKTEQLLNGFHKRVEALRKTGADLTPLDPLEVSGIAGTQMCDTISFDLARWLVRHMPGKVTVDWDEWDEGRAMGEILPRLLPLVEDDALVEADTPWRRWIESAHGRKVASAEWLVRRFESLPLSAQAKAELYDSLRVPLRWDLGNSRVTRTRNLVPVRKVFYHSGPLISRSEVSLADELATKPPALHRLSRRQGEQIIDKIREVMLVRYRELYGTTLGDPASVVRADIGRGTSIYLWNLPRERHLPLRAYVAGLTLKNGVPINYIEAIGLCEWMEVGFNTFYTFRGGEAGWIFAQVLRCLCHLMGATCVSMYPYQLGHDNEEALKSGAFWFYRKLGFRPGRADLRKLVEREEKKIAADSSYRTSIRTLKRLAQSHAFYELPGSQVGAWDRFSTRNIGLKVNTHMAREFGGDSGAMRKRSTRALEQALGVRTNSWSLMEKAAFENFALVLSNEALSGWTAKEKGRMVAIIRAKSKPNEMHYLHLTQQHQRLRQALIKLGA